MMCILYTGATVVKRNVVPFITNTNTTTASDCQTPSGQIPVDQPEEGIDGYGGKTLRKGKF